jgi:hypothetical protein
MDAPMCQKIPGCGKRHWGECSATSGNESQSKREPAQEENAPRVMRPADQLPLQDRVTALEQIVDELLAGKRKRSEYMKQYMRDRRARDGG